MTTLEQFREQFPGSTLTEIREGPESLRAALDGRAPCEVYVIEGGLVVQEKGATLGEFIGLEPGKKSGGER